MLNTNFNFDQSSSLDKQIQFSNQPPNRKSSWTATLCTVSTPGFDFRLNCQLNLSLAQLIPSLLGNFSHMFSYFIYDTSPKPKLWIKVVINKRNFDNKLAAVAKTKYCLKYSLK